MPTGAILRNGSIFIAQIGLSNIVYLWKLTMSRARGRLAAMYDSQVANSQEAELLSVIREMQSISKAELARRTGLSRGTIAARLKGLEDRGLIEWVGKGRSRGGRPPRLVRYKKEAGYIVAVDLGATSLDVALTNLNAEIVYHVSQESDVCDGPGPVLKQICNVIRHIIDVTEVPPRLIKGLGMGLPGPVEFLSGLPVSPPIMPGWHLFPVREYLESEFGWRVFVDNDVNVMALGEKWAGAGVDIDNFIYVKIGTGIGCGIICRGHLYRGADGCAGDIGHIQVTNDSSVICRCGNVGCLEALAGGAALAREALAAASSGKSPHLRAIWEGKGSLDAKDLADTLSRGDPFTVDLVRTAGSTLGHVLASLVNFYNPSLIVIGGGVANLGDLLLASIREAVYRRSLPLATRNIRIKQSELGPIAGVVGAAAIVLEELYLKAGHIV